MLRWSPPLLLDGISCTYTPYVNGLGYNATNVSYVEIPRDNIDPCNASNISIVAQTGLLTSVLYENVIINDGKNRSCCYNIIFFLVPPDDLIISIEISRNSSLYYEMTGVLKVSVTFPSHTRYCACSY